MAFMKGASISTATEDEHLHSLREVLDLLYALGVRLKLSKSQFGVRCAENLDHTVDACGLRPSNEHISAIRALEERKSGEELMRFLGLANYFSDFLTILRNV